jgi:hypothetical protein
MSVSLSHVGAGIAQVAAQNGYKVTRRQSIVPFALVTHSLVWFTGHLVRCHRGERIAFPTVDLLVKL